MKELFLAILMIALSPLCFAQSNGMFVTLRVTDSIWLNSKWVKGFSDDSTMGNGAAGIIPTEKAVKAALGKYAPITEKGAPNGIASLDGTGKVPSGQLSLTASDIPALDATKVTTGVLPIQRGGTGLSSVGTLNQMLRVNSSQTGLESFTPSFAPSTGSLNYIQNGTSPQAGSFNITGSGTV